VPLDVSFPRPAYPFPDSGYADIGAVTRYINSAYWDPDKPSESPSSDQVLEWLQEASAAIDSALAARGYFIPLQVRSDYLLPSGMKGINGLNPAAYLLLQNIAAHYAAAMVQMSRHGSNAENEDHDAKAHFHFFNDHITRLETGADNLTAFGADGAFAPEIDPAQGVQTGNLGAFHSTNTIPDPTQAGPRFSNGTMQF
jgi:hypothetical protein